MKANQLIKHVGGKREHCEEARRSTPNSPSQRASAFCAGSVHRLHPNFKITRYNHRYNHGFFTGACIGQCTGLALSRQHIDVRRAPKTF
jgi:hypothetical protein